MIYHVTQDGPTDERGRTPFTARWMHDGRERAQCFKTDLTEWIATKHDNGDVVVVTEQHRQPPTTSRIRALLTAKVRNWSRIGDYELPPKVGGPGLEG
jgi:hypothetical protein